MRTITWSRAPNSICPNSPLTRAKDSSMAWVPRSPSSSICTVNFSPLSDSSEPFTWISLSDWAAQPPSTPMPLSSLSLRLAMPNHCCM